MRIDGRELLVLGGSIGLGVMLIRALPLVGWTQIATLLLLAALICTAFVLWRCGRRLLGVRQTQARQLIPDQAARLAPSDEARLWTGLIDPPALGIAGRDDVV